MDDGDRRRLLERINELEDEHARVVTRLTRAEKRIVMVGGWAAYLAGFGAMFAIGALAHYRKNDLWDWLSLGVLAIAAFFIVRDMIKKFDKQ